MEQIKSIFEWGSALGVSVILFALMNFVYFLMGLCSPFAFSFFAHKLSVMFGLVFSPRSDMAVFGKTAAEIIEEKPEAQVIKVSVYHMFAGLYLAYSILHLCVLWFGLMEGQAWSLWVLTFSNLAVIGFFLLAARNFSVHLVRLGFGDLMPFATIPGILLPFASIAGFIGIYFN